MKLVWMSPRLYQNWGLYLRTPTRRIKLLGAF